MIPNTEKIKSIKIIKDPTLNSEGRIYIKVSIKTLKFLEDLISLKILMIQKAQIALAAVEKLKSV